jgi:hypothetical protein
MTDEPQSHGLMEGTSGIICFLSDLLRDGDDGETVRFPGYEV